MYLAKIEEYFFKYRLDPMKTRQRFINELAELHNNSNIPFMVFDSSFTILQANKVFMHTFQISPQDLGKKKADFLLPQEAWSRYYDGQRFLSLYTPESQEEVFTYVQPKTKPVLYQKIKIPILTIFGEKDQYRDRPVKNIATWFKRRTASSRLESNIIPQANHSFTSLESQVAKKITSWFKKV